MFQRLPGILLALALACSIGLHWTLLQSLAWTSMLVNNLAATSVSTALERTFDGEHPCPLCKAIAKGRKAEKKADTLISLKKLEALNQSVGLLISAPAAYPRIEGPQSVAATMPTPPPTPPPRAA